MRSRKAVRGRALDRELPPGLKKELLYALHLLTPEGTLNADARRKLKQVLHLVKLLEPAVKDILARFPEPVIVDCGAGKSYLGFLLDALLLAPAGRGTILAIEARPALAQGARALGASLRADRIQFVEGAVGEVAVPERVHLVTALHACDTATDDALALAIRHQADHVAVVPCCQAEVARQLAAGRGEDPALRVLHDHPWHRRELGSHLTNVIRALALEAAGYQVTVTELAGWEHSLKNELILGRRVKRYDVRAREKLAGLLRAAGVEPAIVRLVPQLLEPEVAPAADPS
ncbi:MAG: SAM-dependent methyltransferase [Deltaproteobacteria bacterium]|nr:SAM-dependent methyltransferase [Deltaproteobacteria bacterium]